jgi:hypothetical protein
MWAVDQQSTHDIIYSGRPGAESVHRLMTSGPFEYNVSAAVDSYGVNRTNERRFASFIESTTRSLKSRPNLVRDLTIKGKVCHAEVSFFKEFWDLLLFDLCVTKEISDFWPWECLVKGKRILYHEFFVSTVEHFWTMRLKIEINKIHSKVQYSKSCTITSNQIHNSVITILSSEDHELLCQHIPEATVGSHVLRVTEPSPNLTPC